jgi:hypothetical protein
MKLDKSHLRTFPNLISEEDLQTLKDYIKTLPKPNGKAVDFKKDIPDANIQAIIENVRDKSYEAITEGFLGPLGFKIKRHIFEEEVQIARFPENLNLPGHSDCPQWQFELPYFDLTTIMYINDDYQEGEIYFEEYDYMYKPVAGELLLFPSYFLHGTKVIKPLNGSTDYAQRASVPVFWSLEVEPI